MLRPAARILQITSQSSRRATGSMPVVGSSRNTIGGSPTRATAVLSFRLLPPEYSRTWIHDHRSVRSRRSQVTQVVHVTQAMESADMCRGQKSESKIRRIRRQNGVSRSKSTGPRGKPPSQNPGSPGSHCNDKKIRVRDIQDPTMQQKFRIQDPQEPKSARFNIRRIQDPQDLKTEQTSKAQVLQNLTTK